MGPQLVVMVVVVASALSTVHPATAAAVPGNGQIAFVSFRDGNAEIYAINPDGTGERNLTNDPADDRGPHWSPDGTRIAFASDRNDPGLSYEIFVMNADGSGVSQLTDLNAADLDDPTWSPDGTQLAFVMFRSGGYNIWTINVDGTGARDLTPGRAWSFSPSWSPSGAQIAFDSLIRSPSQIYVMDADGRHKAQVTTGSRSATMPDWSPDGTKLVFTSSHGSQGGLATIHPDGTGLTKLTDVFGVFADWSPDGTLVAFQDADHPQVFTTHADGTSLFQVTHDPLDVIQPDWQPVS